MSRIFFTDRDLGNQFPDILRAAGLHVERHVDDFAPAAPDEEWLERVGREKWTAISHDGRIRYKPNELAAVKQHRVGLLVLVGKAPHKQLAESFIATMPRIEAFLATHTVPFIAKVHRPPPLDQQRSRPPSGNVVLWFPR